jgi:hypothetical protein
MLLGRGWQKVSGYKRHAITETVIGEGDVRGRSGIAPWR